MWTKSRTFFWLTALVLAFGLVFPATALSVRDPLGPHFVWLPYNLKTGDWATGVHIVAFDPPEQVVALGTPDQIRTLAPPPPGEPLEPPETGEVVMVQFWDVNTNENYANVTVPLNVAGSWTGMVQNLLDSPGDYRSGSLLVFLSQLGFFSVTQFIVNSGEAMPGFGHQTFYAEQIPPEFMPPELLPD